ncbi:hypothetical protein [Serratia fonticola]|uniref:Uncharacterized protein n=1 Tax=Serratia fonticola TaxID=47917 RepID=A0A3S4X6J4_SERFO|nr:hypothetical protein [Serratia fonticola]VEI73683.1 Uncharacterised protein [Serratia fonticola]
MKKPVILTIILTALIFSGGVMSSTLKQFKIEFSVVGTPGIQAEIIFAENINSAYSTLRKQKKSTGKDIVIRTAKEIKK